jgi:hypothetical protein
VEMVGKETVLHNRGTSPAFTWKGWEKPGKSSVHVTRALVEFRTQHLSYISQEHYHYANLPGVLIGL